MHGRNHLNISSDGDDDDDDGELHLQIRGLKRFLKCNWMLSVVLTFMIDGAR